MQYKTIAVITVLLLLITAAPAVTGDAKQQDHIPHRGSGR